MRIGVIGSGVCEKKIYKAAEQVGSWIAGKGHVLVCGGLGGVMEAVAKGAKAKDGLTIGILPGPMVSQANPYIDVPIATDLGHARNVIISRTSDLLIAVSGEYGTLSEMAIALKIGRPVFAYQSKWKGIKDVFYAEELTQLFREAEKFC